MYIRSASTDDAIGMSRVLREIIALTGRDRSSDEAFVLAHYVANQESIRCSVAVDAGGDLLGFQSLVRATADNRYGVPEGWGIIGTHISPRAHRQGVGRALFSSSRDAAIAAGMDRINAYIDADDASGLRYYEAMGFRTYREPGDIVQKLFIVLPDADIPDERERPCSPAVVPATMAAELEGYAWARDTVGESGGAVYRLHGKPGAPELFLKQGDGAVADDVIDEMTKMRWLEPYVPVPTVRQSVATRDRAWLLMTAMPGRTAYQLLESQPDTRGAVIDMLAAFLRRLHAIPIAECPFNNDHALRLSRARARINAGLVDVDDVDEERQGWSAEQLWAAMQALLPIAPDPVVTHGDFSLDNILIHQDRVVGCIDLGRVGIADRYQDLAILWNCLGEFDPSLRDRFFRAYGIASPDLGKLRFHLMLDELF